MSALISIIVPVYKVEGYLEKCVQSLLSQTYKNLEVILVDDGSPDSCPAICDRLASEHEQICVVHQENKGVSEARNRGLAEAKGALIGFVDSDDLVEPEMYERLYNAMVDSDAQMAVCDVINHYEIRGGERVPRNLYPGTFCCGTEKGIETVFTTCAMHWNKLYTREVIGDTTFTTQLRVGEDSKFLAEVMLKAKTIAFCNYLGYVYNIREDSTMKATFSSKKMDLIKADEEIYEMITARFPKLRKMARHRMYNSATLLSKQILNLDDEHAPEFRKEYEMCRKTLQRVFLSCILSGKLSSKQSKRLIYQCFMSHDFCRHRFGYKAAK